MQNLSWQRFVKRFVDVVDLGYRQQKLADTVPSLGSETPHMVVYIVLLLSGVAANLLPVQRFPDVMFYVREVLHPDRTPNGQRPPNDSDKKKEEIEPVPGPSKWRLELEEKLAAKKREQDEKQARKKIASTTTSISNGNPKPTQIAGGEQPSKIDTSGSLIEALKTSSGPKTRGFNDSRWRQQVAYRMIDSIMQRGWYQLESGDFWDFPLEEFFAQ